MKLLLDDCIPKDLCRGFPEHECHTARGAGFGGKTNGDLLAAAELAGFQVLITVDRNIPYQQKLSRRKLALLILFTRSNALADLLPHVPACLKALQSIQPGQVTTIGLDEFTP